MFDRCRWLRDKNVSNFAVFVCRRIEWGFEYLNMPILRGEKLGGIGLLAYGSYIKNNNGLPILGILTIILDYVHLSFPWLLIMAAIICILVSFLGCCGAVKKFRGMLTMIESAIVSQMEASLNSSYGVDDYLIGMILSVCLCKRIEEQIYEDEEERFQNLAM
uniref:Uncharacterized protein n=1 Tax=Magallana gigas TaxID=29159 RepID=K1S5G8_MAGGI